MFILQDTVETPETTEEVVEEVAKEEVVETPTAE